MKGTNGYFTSLVVFFGVVLVVLCWFDLSPVAASESSTPSHLTSHRDRLVKLKDTYAAQLAEHIRCMREDENVLREINSHLATNSLNKKDSSIAKFERNICMGNHQRSLDILRSNLAGVDRELLYVEAQIKQRESQGR
ncbi:MAG: hypothetical protein K2X81_25725 [Candidatus Obscuribacterales bacterium]|nr:hypothetical protein [Candidatus Obscuribacterales bacterium]